MQVVQQEPVPRQFAVRQWSEVMNEWRHAGKLRPFSLDEQHKGLRVTLVLSGLLGRKEPLAAFVARTGLSPVQAENMTTSEIRDFCDKATDRGMDAKWPSDEERFRPVTPPRRFSIDALLD